MLTIEVPLQKLLDSLPSSRRDLIINVKDPSGLSNSMPITGAKSIELAGEADLVFCKTELPELVVAVVAGRSRFIIARPEIVSALPTGFADNRVLILTHKPRLLLALLLAPFDSPPAVAQQKEAIHREARISPSVSIGPGVVIGADVEIGPHCVIGPNTVIDHATIGECTQIGPNCSIGGDGFGYEIDEETGEVIKFPHFGRVQIGSRVEISSNCCIDRGSLRDTILEDDVKVNNLVHIAHNCHIKRGALLTANAMVAGSVVIGEHAWVGPSSSLRNGITMGRCAMTGLAAAATKSIGDNEIVVGIPAKKLRDRFPESFPLLRN